MRIAVDMSGKRCGMLTVQRRAESRHEGAHWLCQCDCGDEAVISGKNLRKGQVSCGCYRPRAITHGKSETRTFRAWTDMRRRCSLPQRQEYVNYGGRGISVCDRWASFENFLADMGEVPDGYSIERKDNDGNYEPGNCCWIPKADQAKNRRNTHYLIVNGQRIHMSEAARRAGIGVTTLHYRLKAGWPAERAVGAVR